MVKHASLNGAREANQAFLEARDAGLRAGTRYRITKQLTDGDDDVQRIALRHNLKKRELHLALRAWSESFDESSAPKYRDGSGVRGRKPYGHYADEASCLERMLTMREDEELPWAEIAARLNAEHHRRRDGELWTDRSVAQVYRGAVSKG